MEAPFPEKLSVIIPTYNRRDVLFRGLSALARQTLDRRRYEVVVVDDGSSDGTEQAVRTAAFDLEVVYLPGPHRGPSATRNRGLRAARGAVVLFLGDDIWADERLLEIHWQEHHLHPGPEVAILGRVEWSQDLEVTPFMEFLTGPDSDGMQFGYYLITDPEEAPLCCTYASHLSYKREFLLQHGGFDEQFLGYEDVEMQYRLRQQGGRVLYRPQAVGWHYHRRDLRSFCERSRTNGQNAALLVRKHPGMVGILVPSLLRRRVRLSSLERQVQQALRWEERLRLQRAAGKMDERTYRDQVRKRLHPLWKSILLGYFYRGAQEKL